MKKLFTLVAFVLFGVGCAPVEELRKSGLPDGYSGKTATVLDTYNRKSESEGDIYHLGSVNGVPVDNAVRQTARATKEVANGQVLWLVSASRKIPAGEVTLELVAEEISLMPMFSAFDGTTVASQEVTFVAEPDEKYLVRGNQSWQGGAVWIETTDGEVVSDVVGDAALYEQHKRVGGNFPSRYSELLSLSGGETAEVVKARLGEPDKVYWNSRMQREYGLDRVVFVYEGMGQLRFNSYNERRYLDHKVPSDEIRDSELLFGFFTKAPYVEKRSLIRRVYGDYQSSGTELLDRMAAYVWYHRRVRDNDMKDALAWVCKMLGQQGEGRYNDFLRKLDKSVTSRKLKRHANASIKDFVTEGVTQFSVD